MDDLVQEFLTEANENLEELDIDLVELEGDPNNKDLLGKIFRVMHTIKGTSGFLGLPRLETIAHRAENVLGRFRDGELEVTQEYMTLIFESVDKVRAILVTLGNTGDEPEGDDTQLIAKLDAAYEGKPLSEAQSESSGETQGDQQESGAENAGEDVPSEQTEVASEAESEPESAESGQSADTAEQEQQEDEAPAPAQAQTEESTPAGNDSQPVAESKDAGQQDNKSAGGKGEGGGDQQQQQSQPAQTLRVNVEVLEDLMTMVSELVLTRNQLLQILRDQQESEFTSPLQRLNHVVSDLQEGVMKTRMQPIGNAWSKLPRIIRDISTELSKKINLEMHGQETELDRQVLEMIKDPLTHMVRNSADHGIEEPEARAQAGKPETGQILLNAYHEGGHIIIEISDDGKGLSSEKIKDKAVRNGLANEAEIEELNETQIQQFIFEPGFSTSEEVSNVSGRGVGMDVVRTNIEKIGGTIELISTEGQGSKFIIKIPLTLAIVSALIVEVAGERFAVPQLAVRELVLVSDGGDNRIEYIKGTPVFRLRDQLLPLVSLQQLMELGDSDSVLEAAKEQIAKKQQDPAQTNGHATHHAESGNGHDAIDQHANGEAEGQPAEQATNGHDQQEQGRIDANSGKYIIVAQVGSYQFGIIVDQVFDTEEIVVKPVASILRSLELFSGNTILGDGSVIMILDPAGIAKTTGELTKSDTMADVGAEDEEAHDDEQQEMSLLLFQAGKGAPKAVPLGLVSRLEKIDAENIEFANQQRLIQYRGELMPLMAFTDDMEVPDSGKVQLLVFSDENHSMGLIVDEILDIVDEKVDVQLAGSNENVMGSAIIANKATDVIDVAAYLEKTRGNWFKDHDDTPYEQAREGKSRKRKRVLLVDDSPFFRNMITPLLDVAGYAVTSVEGPHKAFELFDKGKSYDIIVSDIEMPDMSGFEFAEKLRDYEQGSDIPMVALSSHATREDIERGREAGFYDYVAKFDRDTLLNTLSQTLAERQGGHA